MALLLSLVLDKAKVNITNKTSWANNFILSERGGERKKRENEFLQTLCLVRLFCFPSHQIVFNFLSYLGIHVIWKTEEAEGGIYFQKRSESTIRGQN